jgi:4-carboxymuconolactone decarboxylase
LRIPPLEGQAAQDAAESASVPPVRLSTNVFRVLLKHPELARGIHQVQSQVLNGPLDFRLQELAIMRVAWLTGCGYMWSQHFRRATDLAWKSPSDPDGSAATTKPRFAIPRDDLLAVREWRSYPAYRDSDRAVLAVTDELILNHRISTDSWSECQAVLGATETVLIDLIATISVYNMMALILSGLEVELEPDLILWSPDGIAPV